MKKEQYTVIDLFAGCGGLSLGLYQAGWNGIFAVEKNPNAFETLNYNLIERKQHFAWPEWLPVGPLNILDINKKYKKQLVKLRGHIDLVAGGLLVKVFLWLVKGWRMIFVINWCSLILILSIWCDRSCYFLKMSKDLCMHLKRKMMLMLSHILKL